jgi:hypothetical protein
MSHTMLYRCPGPHAIHGGLYDYEVVPDAEIDAALAHGWFRTTPEAKAAHEAAKGEPDRAALEQQATALGIKFDGRTGDKTLADKIVQAGKG